jgi:hypothetical protein
MPVLHGLLQWGNRWLAEEPPVVLRHSPGDHGEHEVDAEWICRTCGERVTDSRVERVLTPAGRRLTGVPDPADDDER